MLTITAPWLEQPGTMSVGPPVFRPGQLGGDAETAEERGLHPRSHPQ